MGSSSRTTDSLELTSPGDVGSLARHATVAYRRSSDAQEIERPWCEASAVELLAAVPWRTFRWFKGQKHYSGTYWCATECGHVIYESRLELARLMFADFDRHVKHIVAQPFLLRTKVGGRVKRHVPDFLLSTDTGPVVVDVKPRDQLTAPAVARTLSWTRAVIESRGWQYEIASEPPVAELENVRFLAGYRRQQLVDEKLVEQLRGVDLDGTTFMDAVALGGEPQALVRASLLHLLWRREFTVDLTQPLNARTVLRRASA
jgi:hypothetical protein